jgi:hypothetical protein
VVSFAAIKLMVRDQEAGTFWSPAQSGDSPDAPAEWMMGHGHSREPRVARERVDHCCCRETRESD